ncbi:hypothetical protein DFO67_13521 [Modicisalibacter xianhensis]|uniref:Uncharacterized protein n=1 Tax=Modicisalibacter xianhensis TaxID=442341 RepID=A0A4R8FHH4_9GAMM|nr:hypothetical protein [Halomonas xianhensis]TDX21611.1 hypothetical protein DFO67_13521 [Halomonas xianhensis]
MSIDYQTLGAPVDGTAGRVIGKGVNHEWKVDGRYSWDTPQPTIPPKSKAADYRGIRFGRMTVIGLLRDLSDRWLCRCSCGRYEARKAKAIRNKRNNKDSCLQCRTLLERQRWEKRRAFYDKHGCWPDQATGASARRLMKELDR